MPTKMMPQQLSCGGYLGATVCVVVTTQSHRNKTQNPKQKTEKKKENQKKKSNEKDDCPSIVRIEIIARCDLLVRKTPFSHLSRIASNMCGLYINCYPKSNLSTTLLLL
ncbi:hypothetical protein ACJW30_05G198000 [Castanea mollissima]